MRSRLFFRENGQVIRTVKPLSAWLQDAFALCIGVALVLALLSWGLQVDERAMAEDAALAAAEARGFMQGRDQALQEIGQRTRDAYAAGMRDATDNLRNTPQGIQLVQSCVALREAARRRQ